MTIRLRPGDVLEIRVPTGLAYVVYAGKHHEYGDAVSVCPATFRERPRLIEVGSGANYITFYPARAAVARGLTTVVGRLTPPLMPSVLRRAGVRSGRTIETWILESKSGETVRYTLTEKERRFPIAAIWNHEFLVKRILEGWKPEMDDIMTDYAVVMAELLHASQPGKLHMVRHYLYFSEEEDALTVAVELQDQEFSTDVRLSGDGTNWLVLASHEIVPTDALIATTRLMMESLVEHREGEYDGWEAEVVLV